MKKRLLTAWIIACMFICLVGQTPITALAEGDDTRVISVPEGLQEILNYDMPETQTVQNEDTTEDDEVQTEEADEDGEGQGEDAVEIPETQTVQEEFVETPDDQTPEDGTVGIPETQIDQDDATVETPETQIVQDDVIAETPDVQTVQEETPENIEDAQQITETNLTASIVASDGNTYETNVTYTSESGIPMEGVALKVTELVAEDEGYDEYIEESASKVGVDTEDILFSKVFDIKIVDENDENIEYEPTGNVDVSIRVVGMSLDEFANLNVLHFVEDKNDENFLVYDVDTTVSEETVEFSTDSFSVYVVIGHEGEEVEEPRVMFHFLTPFFGENSGTVGSTAYYAVDSYEFKNKGVNNSTNPVTNYTQSTQILKNGEALELIKDPENQYYNDGNGHEHERLFYGWHVVDPVVVPGITDEFGIGTSDSKLYYSWPAMPEAVYFEKAITITDLGNGTADWEFVNGASGNGTIDEKDGVVHVFLAPVFEKYNFINFLLYERDANQNQGGAKTLMTRKLVALGSSTSATVKISDVRSYSTDPVHLLFMGWEYNAGTPDNPDWRRVQTVDYTGGEIDTSITVDLADTTSIDLSPIFIQARWADFNSGPSSTGASYVESKFRESWGVNPNSLPEGMIPDSDKNVFDNFFRSTKTSDKPSRKGYSFDGWYAFANMDSNGMITNLSLAEDVDISFIDYSEQIPKVKTGKVNTKAIQISDSYNDNSTPDDYSDDSISVVYDGTCWIKYDHTDDENVDWYIIIQDSNLVDNSCMPLFSASSGKLKIYNYTDRLKLSANWTPVGSKITIVYWTENAQEEGYQAPAVGNEKDDYTASAVKVITTDELNSQSTEIGDSFASGDTITLDQLRKYKENNVSILENTMLEEVGALPAHDPSFPATNEEKFYDLNSSLSNASVEIKGDGSTVFNVYYTRKTFKLVFHIGRDGYVKQNGQQKPEYMTRDDYKDWDGNWIQFMYGKSKNNDSIKDYKIEDAPPEGLGYIQGPTALSYPGYFTMSYNGRTYTSEYVTTSENVMGDYVPGDGENVYVITAKYGAYIADRWPTPTNDAFTFTKPNNSSKTMYTWAAYYDSLYCLNAQTRPNYGDGQNNNPDINGIYEYMSLELCTNRAGDNIINENCVHHIVAYFGDKSNVNNKIKTYHILYKAVDGTYDASVVGDIHQGNEYSGFDRTTWSEMKNVTSSIIEGSNFYERSSYGVISNVGARFQVGWDFDGYDYIYSCFNNNDVYFFYVPKEYKLTFKYDNNPVEINNIPYKMTLDGMDDGQNINAPDGYKALGWYTNEAGKGEPFDFKNERMPDRNLVLYPIIEPIQYRINIDPDGGEIDHINYDKPQEDSHLLCANDFGVIGSGHDTEQSTYFNPYYGTPIGEYSVKREYIKLSAKELNAQDPLYYSGEKYYYVNTQYVNESIDGVWGLSPDLRNAVYFTESQLEKYFNYYEAVATQNLGYYVGVTVLDYDSFCATYTSYPNTPYRPVRQGSENYTFMGWYQVYDNGTVASTPYNFNDPVTGNMTLRAKWRLDGGYYIRYNPTFYIKTDGGNDVADIIHGNIDQWYDPETPSMELYADQSLTNILKAPDNINNSEYVFRGWYVVRQDGDIGTTQYPNLVPMEIENGEPICYQPGDNFTIDSSLVSDSDQYGSIIHMNAYYDLAENTLRRPDVTNLIIDANKDYGGRFIQNAENSQLPSIGSGHYIFDELTKNNGYYTRVLFGDIQSNVALHLYRYASTETYNGITGTNFFENTNGYKLIGFDDAADEDDYIATYAADSVIAVTRNEINRTIYAVWEPMVYLTLNNDTAEDITITLECENAEAISVLNKVTGEFDRSKISVNGTSVEITVKAQGDVNGDDEITLVLPKGDEKDFTATVTNEHLRKKMSVNGSIWDTNSGMYVTYGSTDGPAKYGQTLTYSETLKTNPKGIVVTYTEVDDNLVIFDVNGGIWTETSDKYNHTDGTNIYTIEEDDINDNIYAPLDPIRDNKIFIGWVTSDVLNKLVTVGAFSDLESACANTNWSSPTNGISIDGIDYINYLEFLKENQWTKWTPANNQPFDKILYAIWSDKVTVTFDIVYTKNENDNNVKLHNWVGQTEPSEKINTFCSLDDRGRYITYTLAKGDKVPKPDDPICVNETDISGWDYLYWLTYDGSVDKYRYTVVNTDDSTSPGGLDSTLRTINNHKFNFDLPVTSDVKLITSWMKSQEQTFTFTVRNDVVNGSSEEEFKYTIKVENEKVDKSGLKNVDREWGSVTTTLKNNETYTIRIKVQRIKPKGWSNAAYGVVMDVIDSHGNLVKSDRLLQYDNLTVDFFTSQYQYDLTIEQTPKEGYETTALIEDNQNNVDCEIDNTNCFSFKVREGLNAFPGQTRNVYVPDDPTHPNNVSVVFTNTSRAVVAPTSYTTNYKPFFMMFGFGALLVGLIVPPVLMFRRRREEEE